MGHRPSSPLTLWNSVLHYHADVRKSTLYGICTDFQMSTCDCKRSRPARPYTTLSPLTLRNTVPHSLSLSRRRARPSTLQGDVKRSSHRKPLEKLSRTKQRPKEHLLRPSAQRELCDSFDRILPVLSLLRPFQDVVVPATSQRTRPEIIMTKAASSSAP